MSVSTWGTIAFGSMVIALAGCGGGGSSGAYGSGGSAAPTLAPTVSFSQPAAASSINLGEAVAAAWTSTNATSCTATVSGASGGTFSGSQMTSGTQMIVPTAPGTYTYTLSCSGSGSSTTASTTVTVAPNLLSTLTPTDAMPPIGSTIDPINGDQNPYGLVIAPATAGLITKGDLVVCNFNDATINTTVPPTGNVQGTGTTIIGLHPVVGST